MKFSEVINSDTPVLVDFYASWCGPCQMLAPVLTELKAEVGDRATIIKIDVDKNPQLAASLGIRGVPTLMVYKNGEVKWRQSGVVPKHELKKILDAHA
ncbi:MAG: thioredoxin [Bernardetiaceae bacterium]